MEAKQAALLAKSTGGALPARCCSSICCTCIRSLTTSIGV
jgi:hypothetical protein